MPGCADNLRLKVLLTGAAGFVGCATGAHLVASGHVLTAAVRTLPQTPLPYHAAQITAIGGLESFADWPALLTGVDVVVHLAARVHVMRDAAADPLAQYRAVNVDGTLNLARQAAAAGVKRFVFVSSIKVNGEERAVAYFEADTPQPKDDYARSKWEAEQGLRQIAGETGLEVVILRPPLVYGPGVGANFLALLRAVARGVPLPLGAINNQRSLIYVGNLVDAIRCCLEHPAAAGRTFLVSDGENVSTSDLIRRMAAALGRPARLVALPVPLLRAAATLAGKSALVTRLLDSLSVDDTSIRRDLGWSPPFTLDEGLRETAAWYANRKASPRKTTGKT